jgi:primosomal protein N' (replication factor Y)
MGDKAYYRVALIRMASPELTYEGRAGIKRGTLLSVTLRGKIHKAVVLESCEKPEDFEALPIDEVSTLFYDEISMNTAKFISDYYFSSFAEAIALFLPFDSAQRVRDDEEKFAALHPLPKLSAAQERAYEQLKEKRKALLFGVTGSGKTELYIHRMAEVLSGGGSAILLMPEISLTPQMNKRLKHYFGDKVAIWHSKLTKKRREETLEAIREGRVRIVAGARSALFVPLRNIELIIVDEEHDDSYKAMSRPRYNARDIAAYIAAKRDAQLWMASATPLLTSYLRNSCVRLKEPYIKSEKRYRFVGGETLNPEILEAVERNYRRGSQSLIFVPTRANFKYLYCSNCGKTHLCPFCSVGMSIHRAARALKCHYCGYTHKIVQKCEYCGHEPLVSDRIGTQEAAEIIRENIPDIRVEIFDKDHITTAAKLQKALDRIASGESDVMIGTQMLSKGHDYPNITLSIITGLDYLLGISDYRAAERAVGLLHQIAGRSGRRSKAEVIIQSAREEYFSRYIEDYEEFLKDEEEFARELYPPFRTLARILISDKKENIAADRVKETVERLERVADVEIVGYGKAPVERIAGRYRYSILLRSEKRVPLLRALHLVKTKGMEIDMDPVDFS